MQPSSTKEKIQEQAIKLFKEYNYDQVTVMQICKAAGITKRTFYYPFSSKDEIVDELIGRTGKKVDQLVDVMLQRESNLAFLWAMLREYAVDAEENGPAITAQIYINILQKDVDNDFPQGMVLFRAVVQTITKAQLADEVGNMQPAEEIAYALYHGLRSVAYTWSSCGGSFSLIGGYKRIFQVILAPKLPKEQVFGTDA